MTIDTHDRVLQHQLGTDGLLVVRLHDGEARIQGVGGETATVRSMDGGSLDSLEVEAGDRSLSIRARRGPDFLGLGLGGGRRSTRLRIDVPAGATVVIESASADVEANGLRGDQRYRTASGDLELTDVSGSLAADSVSGDLAIVASGLATLSARTVSGDLNVRAGSVGQLRATTTSGDLRIEGRFDGPGPYTIDTVSGDLVLAPANDVRIEMGTIAGDLRSDIVVRRDDNAGRRAFVMGRGGPTIGFRSTSGDLRLVRPASIQTTASAPTRPAAPTSPTPPTPPTPPAHPAAPTPPTIPTGSAKDEAIDDARLTVLRDLEGGAIDVAEAGRRLAALDAAGDDGPQEQPHD